MVLFQSLMVPVLPGSAASEVEPVLAGHQARPGRDPLCPPGEKGASGAGVPHPQGIRTPPGGLAWRCRARGSCAVTMLIRHYSAAKLCQLAAFGRQTTRPAWSRFLLPELMEHEGLLPAGLPGRERRTQR